MKKMVMKSLEMANLFHKDRLIVFSGLAMITVFAWAYMIHMAMNMTGTGMNMTVPCLTALGDRGYHTSVRHVDHHDGGHDASRRHTYDHDVCHRQRAAE
jgi:predicted metal-binding membrane protein